MIAPKGTIVNNERSFFNREIAPWIIRGALGCIMLAGYWGVIYKIEDAASRICGCEEAIEENARQIRWLIQQHDSAPRHNPKYGDHDQSNSDSDTDSDRRSSKLRIRADKLANTRFGDHRSKRFCSTEEGIRFSAERRARFERPEG